MIICVGISGSGKSTWSNSIIEEDYSYLKINRDGIRAAMIGNLDNFYLRKDSHFLEGIVTNIEESLFMAYASCDKNIIIDNTNLRKTIINIWLNIAQSYKYDVRFKIFDIDPKIAKERILIRDKEGLSTQQLIDVVDKQHRRWEGMSKWLNEYHKDKII